RTVVEFVGREDGAGVAALEQAGAGVEAEAAALLGGAVAALAVLDQDRADLLLEELQRVGAGCGVGGAGRRREEQREGKREQAGAHGGSVPGRRVGGAAQAGEAQGYYGRSPGPGRRKCVETAGISGDLVKSCPSGVPCLPRCAGGRITSVESFRSGPSR